jgi:hypothetical protein
MLGERASLVVALAAAVIAFGLFGMAGAGRGWLVTGGLGGWRMALLALAFAGWMAVLLPWLARARVMTPAQQQRGMYLALGAWAVTDVAIVLGFGVG